MNVDLNVDVDVNVNANVNVYVNVNMNVNVNVNVNGICTQNSSAQPRNTRASTSAHVGGISMGCVDHSRALSSLYGLSIACGTVEGGFLLDCYAMLSAGLASCAHE